MIKTYHAWMLRITQNGSAGNHNWRASLEDPHTRERVGFDTLEALYDYINQFIGTSSCDGETRDDILNFNGSTSKSDL